MVRIRQHPIRNEVFTLSNKLTKRQFNEVVRHLDLSEDQLRRAWRVLVDGEAAKAVAADEGATEQTVRADCRRVVGNMRKPPMRLTRPLFDLAAGRLSRVSERNVQLARRVVVDGEPLAAVASDAGIKPPTLSAVIARIKEKVIPPGWRMVSVLLPDKLADDVEALAEKEHLKLAQEKEK